MKKILTLTVLVFSLGVAQIWNVPQNVSNVSGGDYTTYRGGWSVACDSDNNVHVTWYTYSGSRGIRYMLIPASTHTVGTTETVETSSNYHPSIAVDGSGTPHVTWYYYTNYPYYTKYKAKGSSWPGRQNVLRGYNPVIAVSQSGDAYIASGYWGRFYYRTNQGGSWGSVRTMNSSSGNYWPYYYPTIAYNENTGDVYIAGPSYYYYSGYHHRLLFYRVPGGTGSPSGPVFAAENSYSFTAPSMVVENDNIHIFYRSNDNHVYHVVSTNNGTTWSTPEQIGSNIWEKITATVTPSGNIWVVWNYNQNLYYNVYDAATSAWLGEQQIINPGNAERRAYPGVASDGQGNIHVVYTNFADNDVYYIWYQTSSSGAGRDVALYNILEPKGYFKKQDLKPKCIVMNMNADNDEDVKVKMIIKNKMSDTEEFNETRQVTVPAGNWVMVEYSWWSPEGNTGDEYEVTARVSLADGTEDDNPDNDQKTTWAIISVDHNIAVENVVSPLGGQYNIGDSLMVVGEFTNNGANDETNVNVGYKVMKDGEEVFSTEDTIADFPVSELKTDTLGYWVPEEAGDYTITVYNGYSDDNPSDDTMSVDITVVGGAVEEEVTTEDMVIFKNGKLIYNTGNVKEAELIIYDITGAELIKKTVVNKGHVDVSNLSQGIYFVKLRIGTNAYTHKITVIK